MKPLSLKRPILLFIYFLLPQVIFTATCPMAKTIADTACLLDPSQQKSSSELGIPTGTRHICFVSNIFIDDICSQNQSPTADFFQVFAKYDGSTEVVILKVYWQSSDNTLNLAGVNSASTVSNVATLSQTQPASLQISVFACMDLVNGRVYGALNTPSYSNSGLTSIAEYAGLANMDDFQFYFCKNSFSAACTFTSTYFSFPDNVPNEFSPYVYGGLDPILVRSFTMSEGSGSTILDSINGVTGTFGSGSSSPSWSKTNYGVEFTTTSQFITLPIMTISAGDALIPSSYTASMWIRMTSAPTGDSYIFRHADSAGTQEKFALKVASNNIVSIVVGGTNTHPTINLNPGQWTHVSVTISMKSNGKNYLATVAIDSTAIVKENLLAAAISFSSSDKLTIGGPTSVLATFYRFKIYSPGSHIFTSSSCSNPDVTYSFGLTQYDYQFSCDSSCNQCFSTGSSSCLDCSTSSYGIYNSACASCPTTTIKIDTLCSSCIANCDVCTTLDTCQTCSSGYHTSSTSQCEADTTTDPSSNTETTAAPYTTFTKRSVSASNTATTTSDVSTQVVTIAATGDPVAVQAQVSGRLFLSIQYFKITYSTDILNILKGTAPKPGKGDPSYVPNVSNKIKSGITSRNIPSTFSKYGLSSSFILNFWKKMILIAIITAVIMLLSSIEYGMALSRRSPHKLQILVKELVQNYLLTQLYSCLGEIMLYSTLQYRSLNLSSRSEWFDLIISLVFLALVFIVPIWHFQFIVKYQKIKESHENRKDKEVMDRFQQTNVGVKLFYDLFKDENKYQQFFLIFLAGRDIIFSLLLTLLFDHPLAQMLILLAMNIAMIAYLLVLKPFKNVFNLAQQLFYEALFFVALVTLILLIAVDDHYPNDQDSRETLSRIIIYETLTFKYGTLVITALKVGMMIIEAYRDYKKKKAMPSPEAAKPEAKRIRLETEGAPCLPNGEASSSRKIEDVEQDMDEEGYPMAMMSPQNANHQLTTFARLSTQNSPVHSRYYPNNNGHTGTLQNENEMIDISPMNCRDQNSFNEGQQPQNSDMKNAFANENHDEDPYINDNQQHRPYFEDEDDSRHQSNFNEGPYHNNYQQDKPYYGNENHSRHPSNFNQEPYQNSYQQDRPYSDYASIDMRNRNSYNEEPPRNDHDIPSTDSRHQSHFNQDPYQNHYQQNPPYSGNENYIPAANHSRHQSNFNQEPYQNNYQQDRPYYSENRSDDPPYYSRQQSNWRD